MGVIPKCVHRPARAATGAHTEVKGVSLEPAPAQGATAMVRLDVPGRHPPIAFSDLWLAVSAEDLAREISRRASVPLRDLR